MWQAIKCFFGFHETRTKSYTHFDGDTYTQWICLHCDYYDSHWDFSASDKRRWENFNKTKEQLREQLRKE